MPRDCSSGRFQKHPLAIIGNCGYRSHLYSLSIQCSAANSSRRLNQPWPPKPVNKPRRYSRPLQRPCLWAWPRHKYNLKLMPPPRCPPAVVYSRAPRLLSLWHRRTNAPSTVFYVAAERLSMEYPLRNAFRNNNSRMVMTDN